MPETTTLIIDYRGGITPAVEHPPARYRATIAGEAAWFHKGADAVDHVEAQRGWAGSLPSSIFDEWAGRTVSDCDAICEFPRLTGPTEGK
jgi:hypothetical protein